jgi:multidrug efflux pump
MTSAAFMLGVLPLVIGGGAGAEMRRALGVAVFCGMLGVTVFGIFATPVFYFVAQWAADKTKGAPPWLHWITTPLISVGLGCVFGLSLWRTRSFDLHWAMIIGVSLGLMAGLFVSGAVHVRRRRTAAGEQAEGGTS